MNLLKTVVLSAALAFAANVSADAPVSSYDITGPGVEWSKAKENCKKLGGSWKPIRRICKIDSITTPGL